ncbi:phosphoribosyl-AMP cyclohydrolase [Chlamydiota bacterium]
MKLTTSELKYDKDGLIPAVIQDDKTSEILMLGYMNQEALQKTFEEKKVTFWSRSRNNFWTKGETSGNFLTVCEIFFDCDKDALLIKVIPFGPVCHEGYRSCFYRKITNDLSIEVVGEREFNPKDVYKKN